MYQSVLKFLDNKGIFSSFIDSFSWSSAVLLVMFIEHSHVLCIFGGVNEASVSHAYLLEPMPEAR